MASPAVEWSDWVVRLPGGGEGPEGFIILALSFAVLAYGLVRIAFVVNNRLAPVLSKLITALLVLLVLLAVARYRNDDPDDNIGPNFGDQGCTEELLTRCPPTDDTVPGGIFGSSTGDPSGDPAGDG